MVTDAPVVVLGAGAAGLVAAHQVAARGIGVIVVDHQARPGRKLAITGGGYCNVTNMRVKARCFISSNPHFVKSALARFGPWDVMDMLADAGIGVEERDRGELFCDQRATLLVDFLQGRAEAAGARLMLGCSVSGLRALPGGGFLLRSSRGELQASRVIVATGGLSYPGIGASGLGMDIARSLGIPVVAPRPGLAPLLWSASDRERFADLSGNSLEVTTRCPDSPAFRADLLFTHRGLSGPAALQVSSYWRPGASVTVDLLPGIDVEGRLLEARRERPRAALRTVLGAWLPKRLVLAFEGREIPDLPMGRLSDLHAAAIADSLHRWTFHPAGTAGYDKAEVTVGGVDTRAISSKTLEARDVPGLHFAGEVLDVTGWLGGYNLQWAWSSGHCAGRAV